MDVSYNKEYDQYYNHALERYLIEQEGYDDWDASVAVIQDFDIIKLRYELHESHKKEYWSRTS